jgi:integrase/recombinase XerC
MVLKVRCEGQGWQLEGPWPDVDAANRFLGHLVSRAFAAATVRAYAYDVPAADSGVSAA